MGKLGALLILLAVALIIYFFKPNSQLETRNGIPEIHQPSSSAKPNTANTQVKQLKSPDQQHTQQHIQSAKAQAHPAEIPQYIQDVLDTKSIPAHELVLEQQADGSASIDLKGQFQHVPVAIIGEDGKVKIVETTISPTLD